jgi:hypothetical protein
MAYSSGAPPKMKALQGSGQADLQKCHGRVRRLGRRQRFHLQGETLDLPDDHELSCGHCDWRNRVPKLAVDENFSLRGKRGLRDAGFTYQALRARDNLVAAGFEGNRHQEGGDES